MVWEEEAGSEGPKLLHFVNRKTPFCKDPGKEPLKIQEPLEIPWPDFTPPPSSQSDPRPKLPDLVVYLGNGNQSEPVASPGMGTNQNPGPAQENKNQSETNT